MEKELLSAMMVKGGIAIPKIQEMIREDDFYRPEHRIIFREIVEIYQNGNLPNVLSLHENLRQKGYGTQISMKYLNNLSALTTTTAYAETYAKTIREKASLRNLIDLGQELVDGAYENKVSAEDLLREAEKKILAATMRNDKRELEKVSDVLKSSLENIQHIYNNPGSLRGVPTGLADVEKVLNGLHKSDLILLAARPSMGKTALALNIAVNAAKKDKIVALFSLEMSCEQIGNRMLSSESKVNSLHLNTGNLSGDDMNKLVDALEDLSGLDMFIDDTPGISILDLRSKTRRLKHEIGDLDLIVLDYLQLMQGRSNRNTEMNRQQEISEISRSLKALARELNVPILALSQLSRNVEMRAEKKPQLSDLRESGSLEQDADIVMFLYRDEYYNRDDAENENIAELIIAKNRNGPTTSVRLQFQKEILQFRNLER
ncbi:MAG: replicative DNA helicase, partial [Selenomonadaceae bacterium]|nr:replicative DNA helicase [Selenomonadaceae bacterium]